ncbi:transglutaminase-like domain-containing protein [Streptomyces gardneri]|uniref:Transglutaminase n=1 Tax=Streptomyces gardneri TaxID=66892 RepID=A0A4Y3RB91_9ACTN|nr:transglutaminase family protein [Streptomyces gardneri]GEB55031.1 transglutaminase [Streptomyces gardneri]GHG97361.1 transglutaminase [Streptomyces gardneri]
MELVQQHSDVSAYLAVGEAVDHDHPLVGEVATRLADVHPDAYSYAEAAFAYVRDTIPHSQDSGDLRVTWRASDVLEQGTGICYAKSVAYAALLRARSIPAALCYQRLAEDDGTNPVIHGLVAVLLPGEREWARQDVRGNKPGVDARFSLGEERLAWTVRPELGEVDYPQLYAEPHPAVLGALKAAPDRLYLWRTLPAEL